MQNTTTTQHQTGDSAVDQTRFEDLSNELIQLIAEQVDNTTLRTLRMVSRFVKGVIPRPFAIRFFGTIMLSTRPTHLRKVLTLLEGADFAKYVRKVEIQLHGLTDTVEVIKLLQSIFVKLSELETIHLNLAVWSRVPGQEHRFSAAVLRTIEHASLPRFKNLRIATRAYQPGPIQACMQAHKQTLRKFNYNCTIFDYRGWDNLLQFIGGSNIVSLTLDGPSSRNPEYLSAVTNYRVDGKQPVRLDRVLPGTDSKQQYHIFGLHAEMKGQEAVREGIRVILEARKKVA